MGGAGFVIEFVFTYFQFVHSPLLWSSLVLRSKVPGPVCHLALVFFSWSLQYFIVWLETLSGTGCRNQNTIRGIMNLVFMSRKSQSWWLAPCRKQERALNLFTSSSETSRPKMRHKGMAFTQLAKLRPICVLFIIISAILEPEKVTRLKQEEKVKGTECHPGSELSCWNQWVCRASLDESRGGARSLSDFQ